MNKIDLKRLAAYDGDFALWSAEQAALIRAGKVDRIDLENVAEEIESLGRGNKQEILSRMAIILIHLLKWESRPERRSASWSSSIAMGRLEIARLIEDSPSLQSYPAAALARAKGCPGLPRSKPVCRFPPFRRAAPTRPGKYWTTTSGQGQGAASPSARSAV
ncbi:MAG: DUF29 domain-containing protein [Devosia sp.]|nr:DUF29 domain-containing protein [Devosia sp.]